MAGLNINDYSQEIQNLFSEIRDDILDAGKSGAFKNASDFKDKCDRLFEYAVKEKSDYLFSQYYNAMLALSIYLGDYGQIEHYANDGIKFHEKAKKYEYLTKSYAYLAECAAHNNDVQREVHYSLLGLDVAREKGIFEQAAILASNLGSMFYAGGEYDKAVDYCRMAEEESNMCVTNTMENYNWCNIYINAGNALLAANRIFEAEKARKQILEFVKYRQERNKAYPVFLVHSFFANYCIKMGDIEGVRENLRICLENISEIDEYYRFNDEINIFIEIMFEAGEIDELARVLDRFIEMCRRDNAPFKYANIYYKKRIDIELIRDNKESAFEYTIELLSIFDSNDSTKGSLMNAAEERFIEQKKYEKSQRDIIEKNELLSKDIEKANTENAAKSAFISSMSHELRTPINAVLGMDEMIIRETKEDVIREYAYDIRSAGKNLLAIINDILDYSKLEAGKMELTPIVYSVENMVAEVYNLNVGRAQKKNLAFNVVVEPDVPSYLFGDDVRIRQVINNLLTNAIKYTEKGSVDMHVSFLQSNNASGGLTVSVKDTGIGIKAEDIEKLSKPFERLDLEKNRTVEGTGLGMNIVTGTLAQMNSKIEVESEYGKGSCFKFTIVQEIRDMKPVGEINLRPSLKMQTTDMEALFTAHRANVLVVDDTAINLTVAKGLLKRTAVNVDTAASGQECLEMCGQKHYDIVFLDHRMPEMDGIETLHILKETPGLNRDTPIIALTANVVSGIEEYYIGEGFCAFLPKPVSGAALEKMLFKFLPKNLIDTEEDIAVLQNDSKGIETCGDKDIFLQVVEDYVINADSLAAELKGFADNKDVKNFAIKAHALKNIARMLGAEGLATEAINLEKCADDGRAEVVCRKTDELVLHMKKIASELQERYEISATECKNEDSFDAERLQDGLNELINATMDFDMDRAQDIINELKSINLPDNLKKEFEKINNAMFDFNADELLVATQEMMDSLAAM